MNRYWDLTEQQRAELSREQVEAHLTVELMEKGVVKVESPVLQEVPEVKLKTQQYHGVQYKGTYSGEDSGFVFATIEQAKAFIDAQPIEVASDYTSRSKWARPTRELAITTVELPAEQDVLSSKVALERKVAIEAENSKATAAFNAASKAVNDAVQGVWSDWYECCRKKSDVHRVLSTKAEYERLCDGNQELAFTFLRKAFGQDEIRHAYEWRGLSDPFVVAVEHEESESATA